MKDEYVSFEVAKLLKEKGFDWAVLTCYENSEFRYVNLWNWNKFGASSLCSAPTQQMACDWVEETYGFFIEISRSIDLNGDYLYRYAILDKRNFVSKLNHIYKSKEDAVEAALEYVLKNLI